MDVFDPFGIVSPFLLQAKILVQQLWSQKLTWDEKLDGVELDIWQTWLDQLPYIQHLQVPRCILMIENPVRSELHVFGDASQNAFGAVVYLRVVSPTDDVHVSFMISKTRVAPLKKLSIVRMEMQAAVLAVRLVKGLKSEVTFPVDDIVYWSDSLVVFGYISNESRRFHSFIGNRVAEICDASSPDQWRHIPGVLNPADVCSRGASASELVARSKLSPDEPRGLAAESYTT